MVHRSALSSLIASKVLTPKVVITADINNVLD